LPRDVRRQAPALSRQREIAKGEAYGRKIAEQRLAPRHNSAMAFDQVDDDACILELLDFLEQKLSTKDFERVLALLGDDDGMSASDARDIHPFARAKALGYLAQRSSGDDFKQAHSLLTNNGDLPAPGKPILPMTHQGDPSSGNRVDFDPRRDGDMPKAFQQTYPGKLAAAKARDAARRAPAKDGLESGVGTLLGGLLGSAAGPIGTAIGAQIGGNVGGSAEKGLVNLVTSGSAAPVAHSGEEEGGDDAMPHAGTRDSQGYFPSTTKGFEAEQLKRPAMDRRRRVGRLAMDAKTADFEKRFPEVARIKIL